MSKIKKIIEFQLFTFLKEEKLKELLKENVTKITDTVIFVYKEN